MRHSLFALVTAGLAFTAGPAAAEPFTILVWETPADFALRQAASSEGQAYWAAWGAYSQSLGPAIRGGAPLGLPQEAVSFRAGTQAGALAVDGLVLGGYFQIDTSREEAERLAAAAPSVTRGGAAELRATFPAPAMN